MRIKSKQLLSLWAGGMIAALTSNAQTFGNLTGEISVQLVFDEGCSITNSSFNDINKWALMGPELTSAIDGGVTSNDDSNAVTIACSSGLTPTLTLEGGRYGNSGVQSVSSDGSITRIDYHLNSNRECSNGIISGDTISLTADGNTQDIFIYGCVLSVGQSTIAQKAGTSTNTVLATLAW